MKGQSKSSSNILNKSESFRNRSPLIVHKKHNYSNNFNSSSIIQQPTSYRFSEKWDYEDMKSGYIHQSSQPRVIRISERRNFEAPSYSKNINESIVTNPIQETEEPQLNYESVKNPTQSYSQQGTIRKKGVSENLGRNFQLNNIIPKYEKEKPTNQLRISRSFQKKTISNLNTSNAKLNKSINSKGLVFNKTLAKPKSNLASKLIKQQSLKDKNANGLKRKLTFRKVTNKLNVSQMNKDLKMFSRKNTFEKNQDETLKSNLLKNNLTLRQKPLNLEFKNKKNVEVNFKSKNKDDNNNVMIYDQGSDSDTNNDKSEKDDIRSTGGKNENPHTRENPESTHIKKQVKDSILSSNLSVSNNSSNITKSIKFSNPKSPNIKLKKFNSNDKNTLENKNQIINPSDQRNETISENAESNRVSLIRNLSPDPKLNPFTRKDDDFKISYLPDNGVESSEKQKEKTTNMVLDTDELYQRSRKKTKYSKDVANQLAFIESYNNTSERTSENRVLRVSERREPPRLSHSRVSISRNLDGRESQMREGSSSKKYKYVYDKQQAKYVRIEVFENIDEVSETSKPSIPSEIKNISTITETVEDYKNIVKTSINLKIDKNIIDNPTNPVIDLAQPLNTLQTSLSTKNLIKKDDKIIKKSHSTMNFNSNQTDKHIEIYSNKNIMEDIYSSQVENKKFDIFDDKKESPNRNNSISKNPHLRRNLERRVTTFFEEQEKYFRPIYQDFGECPDHMYRLVIFISEKNSKTDKIFFNNPMNFVEPKMLINFNLNKSENNNNTSKILSQNLKCLHKHNFISAAPESLYYNMSQIVQSNKTLRPSMYHDVTAMEEDFSFPEDKPKEKPQTKPSSFGLAGAIQIDEDTYEINGYQFKVQKSLKSHQGLSSSKSAQNLHTSSLVANQTNINNQIKPLGKIKRENQYKSYTNLPQRSHTTVESTLNVPKHEPIINRNGTASINIQSRIDPHKNISQVYQTNESKKSI